jgi:hypothetical protein
VHPHIYQELTRQHHADLDREAARASLAASVLPEHRLDHDRLAARPPGLAIWIRLRLGLLAGTHRVLMALEGRVAEALANARALADARTQTEARAPNII